MSSDDLVADLCNLTARYLAGDSDVQPEDVYALITEVRAALAAKPEPWAAADFLEAHERAAGISPTTRDLAAKPEPDPEYTPGGLRYPTLDELHGRPTRTDLPMVRPAAKPEPGLDAGLLARAMYLNGIGTDQSNAAFLAGHVASEYARLSDEGAEG